MAGALFREQCMCRDRASKDTENAIQLAHEDSHAGKAVEAHLRSAQAQGVQFCRDLPLLPAMQDVKDLVAKEAKEARAGAGGQVARRRLKKLSDLPGPDEATFFIGKGTAVTAGSTDYADVLNAIGFFMYTHCSENERGEWPQTIGVPPAPHLAACRHMSSHHRSPVAR